LLLRLDTTTTTESHFSEDNYREMKQPRYKPELSVLQAKDVGVKRSRVPLNEEVFKQVTIGRNDVKMGKEIDSGNFGCVFIGDWKSVKVAVKTLKKTKMSASQFEDALKALTMDSNIASSLLTHPRIVTFHGVCPAFRDSPPFFVMEYCELGSLVNFTRSLTNEEKLQVMLQCAQGMEHLHGHDICHRDLAARNVLLSKRNPIEVKLTDFGLSRQLIDKAYGRTLGKAPERWMAPESIKVPVDRAEEGRKYSKESDVWAYG